MNYCCYFSVARPRTPSHCFFPVNSSLPPPTAQRHSPLTQGGEGTVLTVQLMSKPEEYVIREAPARRSGCSWSSGRARGQSRAGDIAAVKQHHHSKIGVPRQPQEPHAVLWPRHPQFLLCWLFPICTLSLPLQLLHAPISPQLSRLLLSAAPPTWLRSHSDGEFILKSKRKQLLVRSVKSTDS